MVKEKCVCLVCHASVRHCLSVETWKGIHYETMHKNYEIDFPQKSELRRRKVLDSKSGLRAEQSMFTKPVKQTEAATIASFKISHIFAKHKKPFEDGPILKEALIEAADVLFRDFRNKTAIMSAVKEV
ncbi:unnamed protein product [Phaedon cochleariae]|uniref:Uncharacterized protein n=1 Tax=Phaedon cochleariae TaxID=80249 RepID=A0A9N9S9A4_PHACE|nr:unnamed protein product [Phaedon cochleariae]